MSPPLGTPMNHEHPHICFSSDTFPGFTLSVAEEEGEIVRCITVP